MSYLLFPGRHLVCTVFQQDYLGRVLTGQLRSMPGFLPGREVPPTPDTIIFAITSANQESSRYNPIAFHIRAMGVDRFAQDLRARTAFRYRVFGIPHYGHTKNFAQFTINEVQHQSEGAIQLAPENCVVICSTPEVIHLYQELGFSILPAELGEPAPCPATPIRIIQEIGSGRDDWRSGPLVESQLANSHRALFDDFPEVPRKIVRIYQDPLTNQEGSLTDTRNYTTYARAMSGIIRLKYLDIREAIRPGRIADEGCADGALLAEISRDFPDSDLYGIDLSAEFAGRFHERQRAGEFAGAYVHFFHRNLLDRIFEPSSIDTTICNSTLHELWSYARQEDTVRGYLAEKFRQLRPGGRLIIRDVVGPENGDGKVFLHCQTADGISLSGEKWKVQTQRPPDWLQPLSTYSRFLVFANDFLPCRRPAGGAFAFKPIQQDGLPGFIVSLRVAGEFLSRKDYIDNWQSELNEEFCFWSFPEWKRVLSETGFQVLENPSHDGKASRAFTNPWIIQNRYENHARLFSLKGNPLPWPPTNMVLVGEKPAGAGW